MRPPKFHGTVIKGHIVLDNIGRFREYKAGLEGKRVELVLREKVAGSSDEQRRYYFGVVVKMLADRIGDSPEDVHEDLKRQFHVESTTKLNTTEFQDYMEKIRQWAAVFHGLPIPDPSQVDF